MHRNPTPSSCSKIEEFDPGMNEHVWGESTTNAIGGQGGTPAVLFHGTTRAALDTIRQEGLQPFQPTYWGPGYEPKAVYLTDSLHQAACNALKWIDDVAPSTDRVRRQTVLETVLVVDVTDLPLLVLGFVTCFVPIGPERIKSITEDPKLRRRLRRETGW